MLSMHILLPKESNFKKLGQFEILVFLIMSTRENIHLIARAPFQVKHFLTKMLEMLYDNLLIDI